MVGAELTEANTLAFVTARQDLRRHVRKERQSSDRNRICMGGDHPRPAAGDPVLAIYRVT
jgi:hypothetical protein